MAGRPRPWRAIAYRPDAAAPNGRRRDVTGRAAAVTADGLRGFKQRQRAAGNVVDVYVVTPLPLDTVGAVRDE